MKTTCWNSDTASEYGREICVTLYLTWLLLEDRLLWEFYKLLTLHNHLSLTDNGPTERNYLVSSSCVEENKLLMSEENGQTGVRWKKGHSYSNNHLFQPVCAECSFYMLSKVKEDWLKQQKTTLAVTPLS